MDFWYWSRLRMRVIGKRVYEYQTCCDATVVVFYSVSCVRTVPGSFDNFRKDEARKGKTDWREEAYFADVNTIYKFKMCRVVIKLTAESW